MWRALAARAGRRRRPGMNRKRLLGFARDDGLTEPHPSTNAEGHHTIGYRFFRLGSAAGAPPEHG